MQLHEVVMKEAENILTENDKMDVHEGLCFIKGILDMLYMSCDVPDGLENIDSSGMSCVIAEARIKLDTLKAIAEKVGVDF